MHQPSDFEPYFVVYNRISKHRNQRIIIKALKLSAFKCRPSYFNDTYYLPKKVSIKTAKKIGLVFTSESETIFNQIMTLIKHTKPIKVLFESKGYKFFEKFEDLKHMDFYNLVKTLELKMEGGFIDDRASALLQRITLKSVNLQFMNISIEKGSTKGTAIMGLFQRFQFLTKLKTLILRSPNTSISDDDMAMFSESLKTSMPKLRNLVIESSRTFTEGGAQTLAKALTKKSLDSFDLNALLSSLSDQGIESILLALADHKLIHFTLKIKEAPAISKLLLQFLQNHPILKTLCLDFSNSSDINEENLVQIQEAVQNLENLQTYTLNATGCHNLKGPGTSYLTQSIGLFGRLTELKVYFGSFFEHETGTDCLDYINENMKKLTNLTALGLDFNNCTDWFADCRLKGCAFLETLAEFKKLKRLSLNLRKTLIESAHVQKFQNAVCQITTLEYFDLDLSFCKFIDDKDIRGLLLTVPSTLNIVHFYLNADDVKYNTLVLNQDIQNMILNSKTLTYIRVSLKKNITTKEGQTIASSLERMYPHTWIDIIGGKALTIIHPVAEKNQPKRPSRFATNG